MTGHELQRQREPLWKAHPYVVFINDCMWLHNIDAAELARRAHLSEGTISLLLHGVQNPETISNPTHQRLSRALRVSMGKLLTLAGYDLNEFADTNLDDAMERIQRALEDKTPILPRLTRPRSRRDRHI